MNLGKKINTNKIIKSPKSWFKCTKMSAIKLVSRSKFYNMSLFSLFGTTILGCNASQEDQCYSGLGVIAGAFCASQNDVVVNPVLALSKITSTDHYELTPVLDGVEFTNSNTVSGTKYTLTDGDILSSPGKVSLNLINSGSIDGQKIFNAPEIELTTQGTAVILTTDWYNNDLVTIKGSDQSVTLNDLQASNLDSAKADDDSFYPGTDYKIESISAPDQTIFLYFNEDAILGTSTEVNLLIRDASVGIQGAVFIDPSAGAVAVPLEVDPFAVAVDTNIEKLNIVISDTNTSGTKISNLAFSGLETLEISGGKENYKFEIVDPLNATLVELNASEVPADLVLDASESLSRKTIALGSGDDYLMVGDALIASSGLSDLISGGTGSDKLSVTFAGATTVSPTLSSFEIIDLSFNGDSALDFSKTSDLNILNILNSSAGISLENVPFDVSKINVLGSQTGAWLISYEDNASSTVNLNWSNDTGAAVTVTSLVFDEVQSLSLTADGADDVVLTTLSLDSDDTKLTGFTNTDDGNLTISSGAQLENFDAVTGISLTATEGGNILLGSAALDFGISDAPKLSTITLVASQTGSVELGSIGSGTAVEDLQSISLSSSGANISLGSIVASNTGTFSSAISSSATVSVGELNLQNPGTSFVVTGSGTLDPITFSNEAYTTINLSDLVTDATISFVNADIGVNIVSGSGNDTITLGLGVDVATGNNGSNIFVVNNGSTGLTVGTADTITDFQFGTDKLKLGLAGDGTVDTGNYVENPTGVEDYATALSAANSALNTLNNTSAASELYAFEYDSNLGYLFIDSDSDGAAEDLIILSGVESTTISAGDIIA